MENLASPVVNAGIVDNSGKGGSEGWCQDLFEAKVQIKDIVNFYINMRLNKKITISRSGVADTSVLD